jgi:hypothetical protein
MADFVYITGPEGRDVRVDELGRLMVNSDASTSGFIFGYGEKGYPLLVDGAGRLLVNASGSALGGSGIQSINSEIGPAITIAGDGSVTVTEAANVITVSGGAATNVYTDDADAIPSAGDTYDLGAEGTRFAIIFAESGNFDHGIQVGSGTIHIDSDTVFGSNWSINESGVAQFVEIQGSGGTSYDIEGLVTTAELESASGVLRTDVDANTSAITSNDTDIANLNSMSGIHGTLIGTNASDIDALEAMSGVHGTLISANETEILANDVDIAALQTVSGEFYKTNADLIPTAHDTFNIGSEAVKFHDIQSASGHFGEGIVVGTSGSASQSMNITSSTTEDVVSITNEGDAIAIDIDKTNTGSQPVVRIANSGTGYDLEGGDWYIAKDGTNNLSNGSVYRTEVDGAAFWTQDGALYYTDIAHSLGQKYVIAQYYNPSNDESIGVEKHVFTDTNNLRVYASTSGALGVIVMA